MSFKNTRRAGSQKFVDCKYDDSTKWNNVISTEVALLIMIYPQLKDVL